MTTTVEAPQRERSLAHLPVGAFAMVMGLAGLALAWQFAGTLWGFGPVLGRGIAMLALAVFVLVGTGYAIKAVRHRRDLVTDWTHPVKAAFTATMSIGLLVMASAFLEWLPTLSAALWWTGAAAQAAITLWVVHTWIAHSAIEQGHVHPGWFIPAVGNIVAPIAGVAHASPAITWYFFGVGAVYYVGLLPIVLARLFTTAPLPARLAPTLAIMIAPPAVATIAWVRLGGSWDDALVKVLLGVAIFQFFLLMVQSRSLIAMSFGISSWAFLFPLAALATALFSATLGGSTNYRMLAGCILVLATAVAGVLLWQTGRAAARGEICRPE